MSNSTSLRSSLYTARVHPASNIVLRCMDFWRTISSNFLLRSSRQRSNFWNLRGSSDAQTERSQFDQAQGFPRNASENAFKSSVSSETWEDYLTSASQYDKEFSDRLSDDLETLLLFATLFSAVITAFLIESYKSLQEDDGDAAVQLLRQILTTLQTNQSSGGASEPPSTAAVPFVPTSSAMRVNACWFASLILSLSTAFFAILAKQWILELKRVIEPDGPSLMRARMRQFYTDNATTWKLYFVITSLPILLHISLLLFLIALVEFLKPINNTVATISAGLVYFVVAVYALLHIASSISSYCPYRTSMTVILRQIFRALRQAWRFSRAGADNIAAFQSIRSLTRAGLELFDPEDSGLPLQQFMRASALLIPWIVKSARAVGWGTWAPFTYYWAPTLIASEVQHVLETSDTIDLHALAWLIDRSSEFNRKKTRPLARELCKFGTRLIPFRSLFLGRGINILVQQFLSMYTVGETEFRLLPRKLQTSALQYSTTLAQLSTEVAERDATSLFFSDGVPYHIDWVQRATVPIASIFPHRPVEDIPWSDTDDIRFFANMLRLQIFLSSTRWYWSRIRSTSYQFLELLKDPTVTRELSDDEFAVLVNTTIYIGTCRLAKDESPQRDDQTTSGEVVSDNVYTWLREHTPRTLDTLSALMLNRLDIPFAVRRQICWGIWAFSGDSYFIKPLIPVITTTEYLSAPLAKYMTSHIATRPSLSHAVLVMLEGLLYDEAVLSSSSNSEDSPPQDRTQLVDALVAEFLPVLRALNLQLRELIVCEQAWVLRLLKRVVRISGHLSFYYHSIDTGRVRPATLFILHQLLKYLLNLDTDWEADDRQNVTSLVFGAACRLATLPVYRPLNIHPVSDDFMFDNMSPQSLVAAIVAVLEVVSEVDAGILVMVLSMITQLLDEKVVSLGRSYREAVELLLDDDVAAILDQSLLDLANREPAVVSAADETRVAVETGRERVRGEAARVFEIWHLLQTL